MVSGPWRLTLSSPTSSAAVSAMKRVSSAWLTSGGKSARKSRLAVAPKPPATPSAIRRIRSSTRFIDALLKQRTVPAQDGPLGDDVVGVPGMDLRHADDDGIDRADVARDDRLERGRDVAPNQHL